MEGKSCHLISKLVREVGKKDWNKQVLSIGLHGTSLIVVLKETQENFFSIDRIRDDLKVIIAGRSFRGRVVLNKSIFFSDKHRYRVPKRSLKAPRWLQHIIGANSVGGWPLIFVVSEGEQTPILNRNSDER
jgi:hypothetical protein